MKPIKLAVFFAVAAAASVLFSVPCAFAQTYSPELGEGYISFDYSVIQCGTVNNTSTATLEKNVLFEGRNALKITPTPAAGSGSSISVDSYDKINAYDDKVDLTKYKYAGVTYYYDTDNPSYTGKAELRLLSGKSKVISSTLSANSTDNLVTNAWTECYFIFGNEIVISENAVSTYLTQLHFRPFGGKNVFTLTQNDVIYISKITFYEECPDPDATLPVTYLKNNPDATGESFVNNIPYMSEFTLPACPFTLEGGIFAGWRNTFDNVVYPAGTTAVADRRKNYVAEWETVRIYPDFISRNYSDHSNGIVDNSDSATVTKETKDGRSVVKIVPNTDSAKAAITLDSYSGYEKLAVDLGTYKWISVEYLYESENPVSSKPYLSILNKDSAPVLTARQYLYGTEKISPGEWTTMFFDLSVVENYLVEQLSEHPLYHLHFAPLGQYTAPASLDSDDVIYIGRIVFSKEKPVAVGHESYMQGYSDGTFRPGTGMTRAEACAIIARLMCDEDEISGSCSFTDVPAGEWYAKYIGFCEEKGLLGTYSGGFLPEEHITKAQFASLLYLSGIAENKELPSVLQAVGNTAQPKSELLTRAEAAVIINRALGRTVSTQELAQDMSLMFLDVDESHWAYADIAEACIPHAEKDGKWLYCKADPLTLLNEKLQVLDAEAFYNLPAGRAKVAELDELEAQRIQEIRNTPNMDISGITGKVVYVSQSTGNDENDGLSPETCVKTVLRANEIVNSGGAVLLCRGDLWREKFGAKAGVTYTAYGEGAKPKIYGSPENGASADKWKLVYENTETGALIWEYQYASDEVMEKFTDVGTMFFNGGEGYAMKEIPSCSGADFVVRGNPDKAYDYTAELDKNLEFFHAANSEDANGYITIAGARGPLYLRCDNGNPGKVFDSIEFVTRGSNITVSTNDDVTIDNLCLMYGNFGISAGTQKNLTVTNCEIGYIGGSIQKYGKSATGEYRVVRYGNGVEVYGGCNGYYIDNCYVYECYDAGITHQLGGSSSANATQNNILYSNNVITDCVYNIEYFLGISDDNPYAIRTGNNVVFESNLLRRAGFGFGSFRPDAYNQRHIRSGTSRNEFTNYIIRNNIFDRAVYQLTQTYTSYKSTAPVYEGNIYIQGVGNKLLHHSKNFYADTDISALRSVRNILGDKYGWVYYVDYIPVYSFSYVPSKTVAVTDSDRA